MGFILEARKFFKKEEKLPFQFNAIEERRSEINYFAWIIGIILAFTILVISLFLTSTIRLQTAHFYQKG